MTAEPPQSPITEAVRSLEVRWIFPGQLETAVAGRFGRFPAAVESARTPTPLLAPRHTVKGLQTSSDLARPAGFEPATRCLEGSCSVRLSYGRPNVIVHGEDHVTAT